MKVPFLGSVFKKKKKNYADLYLDILKIGVDKAEIGLTFEELLDELYYKGYDTENDCIILAVKQWFYESFHHRGVEDNPYNSYEDLDRHKDCSFILNGDSCLRLIEYDKTKNSTNAGWFSLVISVLSILFTVLYAVYIELKM